MIRSNDQGATFSFNGDGYYVDTNGTVLTDQDCTMDITSAKGLEFFVVAPSQYGSGYEAYGNDWVTITPESSWDDSEGAIQDKSYTIKVGAYGANRTATILALPQTVAATIDEEEDLNEQLLDDNFDIKEELKPYIFATIEQAVTTAEEEGFSIEVNSSTSHMVGEGLAATFVKVDSEQYFYDHMDDSYLINYYEYFMNGVPIYVLTFNSAAAEGGGVLFDIKSAYDNATIPAADTWLHAEYMPDDYNPGWTMMMIDMSKGQANAKSNITFTNANGSQTYAILLCYRNY